MEDQFMLKYLPREREDIIVKNIRVNNPFGSKFVVCKFVINNINTNT